MLRKIINNLRVYFKTLWAEVKKALTKKVPVKLTYSETRKILEGKGKNELLEIVIRLTAEREGTIPVVDNKRSVKQQYSKTQFINGIMGMLAEKYMAKEIKKEAKKAASV
jgi:hypothetical protein